MPKFTITELEKLNWSQQSWSEVMRRNMQLLEDTLLKVDAMLDVNLTSLADNDILKWDETSGKFINVPFDNYFSTTTTTTSTSSTTTTTI